MDKKEVCLHDFELLSPPESSVSASSGLLSSAIVGVNHNPILKCKICRKLFTIAADSNDLIEVIERKNDTKVNELIVYSEKYQVDMVAKKLKMLIPNEKYYIELKWNSYDGYHIYIYDIKSKKSLTRKSIKIGDVKCVYHIDSNFREFYTFDASVCNGDYREELISVFKQIDEIKKIFTN